MTPIRMEPANTPRKDKLPISTFDRLIDFPLNFPRVLFVIEHKVKIT